MADPKLPAVHVFKVALAGAKRTWRRIAIRDDQTLDDLHESIFALFHRYELHLYSFFFTLPGAKGRNWMEGAKEYTSPLHFDSNHVGRGVRNASKTHLRELPLEVGQVFVYIFDFGDDIRHEVTVEKLDLPVEEKAIYPKMIESKGASPDQYPISED